LTNDTILHVLTMTEQIHIMMATMIATSHIGNEPLLILSIIAVIDFMISTVAHIVCIMIAPIYLAILLPFILTSLFIEFFNKE
jgi:CBS domain containing-hemolysin-like protein